MSRVPELPEHQPAHDGPRASDAERDRTISVLRDQYVAGGLSLEEFAERAELALSARTVGDLAPLTKDLQPIAVTPAVPVERTGRVRRATRWTVAVMSGHNRRGRWRVEDRTVAVAVMGGVNLDLRDAILEPAPGSGEIEIIAVSVMGGVNVLVPEGVPVYVSGFSFMGGTEDRSNAARHAPGVPAVHVRAYNLMGGVNIRTAKPRRPNESPDKELTRLAREDARAARADARAQRAEARAQRHRIRHDGRDIGRQISEHVQASIAEGLAGVRPRGQTNLPPWLQRIVQQHLGPDGIDRYINERTATKLRSHGIDPDAIRNSLEYVASWVSGERVDLRNVAAPDGTVTILFTDIEGSSRINEQLGDQRWIEVLREHNAIIRDLVGAYDGSEVRSLGDGFMIVFSSARRALHCAVAIQRAFDGYAREHVETPLRVRIGCHTGEAIRDADDFFGRNVVLAARIADRALGGQILVSSVVKELTESTGDIAFGQSWDVALDGLSGTKTVYEVKW